MSYASVEQDVAMNADVRKSLNRVLAMTGGIQSGAKIYDDRHGYQVHQLEDGRRIVFRFFPNLSTFVDLPDGTRITIFPDGRASKPYVR
ncbi:MAG: hypothetical protein IPK79_03475 [Vampirovibrionales bacterium]|nr:hypothetical protein [Vampirovibrionales bacterium]